MGTQFSWGGGLRAGDVVSETEETHGLVRRGAQVFQAEDGEHRQRPGEASGAWLTLAGI